MPIEQKPFTRYKLDNEERAETFTTRLTVSDKGWFIPAKKAIKQPKTSTAMKQLAEIGAIVVLHDPKLSMIIDVIMGNSRRNKRLGIPESELDKV